MSTLTGYAEPGIVHPKGRRRRASDGYNWSTALADYEAYNAAHIANYGITATETGGVGASGEYTFTDPSPGVAGNFQLFAAAGSNLAVSDLSTGLRWVEDVEGAVTLDLTTAVPTANTANTLGDCLNAARAQGFGKWVLDTVAKTLTLYAPNGTTIVRTFTLDSVTSPTSRT